MVQPALAVFNVWSTQRVRYTGSVETETEANAGETTQGCRPTVHVLYLAFHGSDPMRLPSRHVLADIDVVQFGRGVPSVSREHRDGLRNLMVRIPDSLMSSVHGRLVHAHGEWLVDDPLSKNGVAIDGVRTRSGKLVAGQVLSLGNTILCMGCDDRREPLDLDAAALAAPRPELATFDAAFGRALEHVSRLATERISMLVLGETGTGKEVVAHAIHDLSGRRGPFVAVNCAAIAPSLLEAELFGHRRGAFSGALADRPGHVRSSDHGTLFLDEIAELPLQAQAALLRVLQEREVVPVGDTLPVPVDLRIVAATNRDLTAMVTDGKFRQDLYARIAGFRLTLPPLRVRRIDLGLLIRELLRRRPHASQVKVTWQASTQLFRYAWPGNIRELESTLEGATALARSEPITLDHLPAEIREAHEPAATLTPSIPIEALRPLTRKQHELKRRLEELLRDHDDNLAEVARTLGKDRAQIYRWLRRLGLSRGSSKNRNPG